MPAPLGLRVCDETQLITSGLSQLFTSHSVSLGAGDRAVRFIIIHGDSPGV